MKDRGAKVQTAERETKPLSPSYIILHASRLVQSDFNVLCGPALRKHFIFISSPAVRNGLGCCATVKPLRQGAEVAHIWAGVWRHDGWQLTIMKVLMTLSDVKHHWSKVIACFELLVYSHSQTFYIKKPVITKRFMWMFFKPSTTTVAVFLPLRGPSMDFEYVGDDN